MGKQAHEQLRPYLLPGETLLWSGRPAKHRAETILLTVVAVATSCVWLIVLRSALVGGGGTWVGLFVLSILGFVAWKAVVNSWTGVARTAYGVTERRVLIVEPGLGTVVKSIDYWHLRAVQRSGRPEFGTIRCARSSMPWKNQDRPGRVAHPALFRRITEASAVHDLILEQQNRLSGDV
jgi:hypothetical protein